MQLYTNADLYSNIYSTGRPPFWRNWREIPSLPEGRFGNQEMNPPFTRRRRRRRAVAFCLSSLLSEEETSGRHWNGEKKSVEGGEEDVEEEEEEESANISGFSQRGKGRSRWRRKCERPFPPFPSFPTDIYGK